jgi:glycosyltransferase involved in cell wall biosynthesis
MNKILSKVSIVLPTYNGAKYIRKSIDSCLNQTYKNLELIIVDDGSTDKTYEIIKSFRDKRIKYIKHKKNKGLPFALNTGFANSTGDYLTWTSDDNFYTEKAIEKMLIFLNKSNIDLVYTDYFNYLTEIDKKILVKLPDKLDLKKGNLVGPCFLYTRRVYENIGNYNAKYVLVEDYEYWIRVCKKKYSSAHYPYPLYIYRCHSNALTNTSYWEVILFDSILKYQNNFITLHELTKKIISFFINIFIKKRDNFLEIILKNYLRILKISFHLSILYLILLLYFLFYGGIKILKKILKKITYEKENIKEGRE